jgi:hypothetical protein
MVQKKKFLKILWNNTKLVALVLGFGTFPAVASALVFHLFGPVASAIVAIISVIVTTILLVSCIDFLEDK